VFAQYRQKATLSRRCIRIAIATGLYTLFACAMIICIDGQFPDRPHVRGDVARMTDTACLAVSGFSFVVLLFYVLDAVWIASRLFKGISGPVTHWPQALLNLETARFRVRKTDLSGYLDVRFAAEKSAEVGQLVIYPFVVQFIFIISRNSYFDNWTWPRGLIVMFIINIVLACTAWATLRQTAKTIRDEALERLQDALDEADFEEKRKEDASVPQNKVRAMTTEVKEESYRFDQREDVEREQTLTKTVDEAVSSRAVTETRQVASPVISTLPETIPAAVRETVGLKERRHGLTILQRAIQNEQRGAYARLFQDPTLLAMILPSGICGIALIIFRALFTIG
jgi:soluble cytochrome b562